MNRRTFLISSAVVAAFLSGPMTALAIDETHKKTAEEMAAKAVTYLKSKQDKATGGWSTPKEGSKQPNFPAITGLVVSGMLLDPKADQNDSSVLQGIKYMLNFQQEDGGIYDKMLPSYNTSICLSALSKSTLPQAKSAVEPAQNFLRKLQYGEASDAAAGGREASKKVGKEHPFYGGVGYGNHGRPDLSNTQFMLQALQDSGVSPNDEAVQRAVKFLQRCQMLDGVNDMEFAKGSKQGGFVYATVENAESMDNPPANWGDSEAGKFEETMDDGSKVSKWRCYGSMTYAGFKSYIYAALPRNDARVQAALGWIRKNYTLEENPGLGGNGMYYYYLAFSRALRAWGEPTIEVNRTVKGADGKESTKAESKDWANDLIDKLATLQNEDGSFKSVDKRWMEDNSELITAYALIALREAAK